MNGSSSSAPSTTSMDTLACFWGRWVRTPRSSAFCSLGYFLAAEIDRLQTLIERGGWVFLGLLVLLFLAWRVFGKRAKMGRRIAHRRAGRATNCVREKSAS